MRKLNIDLAELVAAFDSGSPESNSLIVALDGQGAFRRFNNVIARIPALIFPACATLQSAGPAA